MAYGHTPRLVRTLTHGTTKQAVERLHRDHPTITDAQLREGFGFYRELGDGRYVALLQCPRLTAMVVVGTVPHLFYDKGWFYGAERDAVLAYNSWDGNGTPPRGWTQEIEGDACGS